jgi:hypothetical protein
MSGAATVGQCEKEWNSESLAEKLVGGEVVVEGVAGAGCEAGWVVEMKR